MPFCFVAEKRRHLRRRRLLIICLLVTFTLVHTLLSNFKGRRLRDHCLGGVERRRRACIVDAFLLVRRNELLLLVFIDILLLLYITTERDMLLLLFIRTERNEFLRCFLQVIILLLFGRAIQFTTARFLNLLECERLVDIHDGNLDLVLLDMLLATILVLLVHFVFLLAHLLSHLNTELLAFLVPAPLVDLSLAQASIAGNQLESLFRPTRLLFKLVD